MHKTLSIFGFIFLRLDFPFSLVLGWVVLLAAATRIVRKRRMRGKPHNNNKTDAENCRSNKLIMDAKSLTG